MTALDLRALTANRAFLLVASRMLSTEIDEPFYRALLATRVVVDEPVEPQVLEMLSAEFCRLFVGPRPVCPPYESLYRGEAVVGGRAERRMKDFMARHDLKPAIPPGFAVLTCDHLAVNLALLHHVLGIGGDGPSAHASTGSPAARELLEEHVLPWAPAYLRDLHAATSVALYATIAQLAAELLANADVSPGH